MVTKSAPIQLHSFKLPSREEFIQIAIKVQIFNAIVMTLIYCEPSSIFIIYRNILWIQS